MNNLIEFLKQEGVSAQLVEEVRHYSEEHTVDEALKKRIPVPHFHYYGNKVWEEALAVLPVSYTHLTLPTNSLV